VTGQWVVEVFQIVYAHPWSTFFFLGAVKVSLSIGAAK